MDCSLPGSSIRGILQARLPFPSAETLQADSLSSEPPGDLTEAEDIKQRWQEYTEELYKRSHRACVPSHKKDLSDPYNYDGVITH